MKVIITVKAHKIIMNKDEFKPHFRLFYSENYKRIVYSILFIKKVFNFSLL